jgi:3-isopropylmalate dehydrogenase
MSNSEQRNPARLVAYLGGINPSRPAISVNDRPVIGVLEGTGIGSQVIGSALQVLDSVGQVTGVKFEVRRGALIGEDALTHFGQWLPEEVVGFCSEVFRLGGAILSGPGGGRYVYDLRRRFDLFSKFVPIRPWPELAGAGRMVPRYLQGVDILLVRDNVGGVYQGEGTERITDRGRVAEHSFQYSEREVQRIVEVAARAAADRRGGLHVIVKDGGIPGMSALWREIGTAAARKHGVEAAFMNVDLMAYELIQNAARFDVIVAPNLFGDVLADIAGVLVSSRGVTFSGNFNAEGHGVFQTNHGSAHDLAGTDTANPAGQILSLAMLLRESFGLHHAAATIETSLAEVWRQGFRTADLAEPGCQILGTNAMTERFVQQVLRSSEVNPSHETCVAAG